jgi:hypothetical protein
MKSKTATKKWDRFGQMLGQIAQLKYELQAIETSAHQESFILFGYCIIPDCPCKRRIPFSYNRVKIQPQSEVGQPMKVFDRIEAQTETEFTEKDLEKIPRRPKRFSRKKKKPHERSS